MSSTEQKISNLTNRRQAVERELADIVQFKSGSDNTALVELEAVLTAELDKIDQQLGQLRTYLTHVQANSDTPQ